MTVIAFLVDGITNTGRSVREALSVFAPMGSASRPLGALSGVRPGTPTATVTASSSTVTVGEHSGLIDAEAAGEAGPYLYAVSAAESKALQAADASNARVDIVSIQMSDPNEGDGSSTGGPAVVYTPGVASSAPAVPATPARSLTLAQINVPKSGGGSPTVTWVAPWVAEEPTFPTLALLQAWTPGNPNQRARVNADPTAGNNGAYDFTGGAWAGGEWQSWTPALQATSFAQSGGTFAGRYKKIGKTVIGHATISLASVSNSGSGTYKLTLPVPPAASESGRYVGQVWAANSGSAISNAASSLNGAPLRADGIVPITFTGTTWQNGNPLGALANATIVYTFAYEAAA